MGAATSACAGGVVIRCRSASQSHAAFPEHRWLDCGLSAIDDSATIRDASLDDRSAQAAIAVAAKSGVVLAGIDKMDAHGTALGKILLAARPWPEVQALIECHGWRPYTYDQRCATEHRVVRRRALNRCRRGGANDNHTLRGGMNGSPRR